MQGSEKTESPATSRAAAEATPPTQNHTRFTILAGKWNQTGNELVQLDASQRSSALTFGDDQWTDYDFSVDAMRAGGKGSFSLFFRSTFWGNELEYRLTGDEKQTCHALAREQGVTRALKNYDFRIQDRAWYTARVHVRGGHIFCSIYDSHNATETRVFDFVDEHHPRGRVGLQTFGSAFRFKNIKVTSPDGKVLWEGLPAVASATPSEVSRAIEIKELAPSSPVATTKTQQTTEKPELTTATRNVGRSDAHKVSVSPKTAKNKVADAFQPGTIWTGKHVAFTEGTKKANEASAKLTVRERNGEAFRARYVVGDKIREINGTIKDGQIGWYVA